MPTQQRPGRKIIRAKEVSNRSGKSRTQIWRDVRAGKFPAPLELGPNSIGWYEDEIDDHLANLPRRTYGAGGAHAGPETAIEQKKGERDLQETVEA